MFNICILNVWVLCLSYISFFVVPIHLFLVNINNIKLSRTTRIKFYHAQGGGQTRIEFCVILVLGLGLLIID